MMESTGAPADEHFEDNGERSPVVGGRFWVLASDSEEGEDLEEDEVFSPERGNISTRHWRLHVDILQWQLQGLYD